MQNEKLLGFQKNGSQSAEDLKKMLIGATVAAVVRVRGDHSDGDG